MLKNPILNVLLGALATALAVAAPLIDDGVTPSEIVAIALAFLGGAGFTAVPNSRASKDSNEH